jgi:glycosyltransferase involved in cell wall biosynthesis
MRVCFVVVNEMLTGIVPSQVIAPARAWAQIPDVSVEVVFLEPARIALGRRARTRIRELRRMWPGGRVSCLPYVGRLGARAPARTLEAYLVATRARRGHLVLHCRGPEATVQGADAARRWNGRVVFDARGVSGHEALLRLAAQGRGDDAALMDRAFREGEAQDRRAVVSASAMLAVSQPLADKLIALANGRRIPCLVVPCCVDRTLFSPDARREVRHRLGLAVDDILLVHTSTEARWEAFDKVLELARGVLALRPMRLLFLTTLDPQTVTASLDVEDPLRAHVDVRRARPDEMAGYLSAADVGILLRRPHATHHYASPVKFAEYLAAGLIPVVSDGIGTAGAVVRESNLGVVVHDLDDDARLSTAARAVVAEVAGDRSDLRQRAVALCAQRFTWMEHVPTIRLTYGLDCNRE